MIVKNHFETAPFKWMCYDCILVINGARGREILVIENDMQDMSYVEIAADEGVSPQAVQQSIARSLIFLKKILAGR